MQTETTPPRYTLAQIKAANKDAGRFFFSRDANRFFNSRFYPGVYQGSGGIYFVHSSTFIASSGEKFTRFNLARFNPADGHVTHAEEYPTLDQARDAAKQFAKGE